MLNFTDITLQDKGWIQPLLDRSNYGILEYNFTFYYIWRDFFHFKVTQENGYFILKSSAHNGSYLYPAGSGDVAPVLEAMMSDARDNGNNFILFTILEEHMKILETLFPGRFEFEPLTDYNDYIYNAQSLITLAGKKLHSKRNHINRFKLENPDWSYEPITPSNMPEVMRMSDEWCRIYGCGSSETLQAEICATRSALADFFGLGMDGGLIRAGGQVIAFSLGDRLNSDTYLVHIEKAYGNINGAYTIINQQFAEHNCADYTFVNREDDSGDEGLRKAKKSYRPCHMGVKYLARLKDE